MRAGSASPVALALPPGVLPAGLLVAVFEATLAVRVGVASTASRPSAVTTEEVLRLANSDVAPSLTDRIPGAGAAQGVTLGAGLPVEDRAAHQQG